MGFYRKQEAGPINDEVIINGRKFIYDKDNDVCNVSEIQNSLVDGGVVKAVMLPDGRYVTEKLARELEGLEEELDKWRHSHFNGERDGHFSGEYLERTSQLDLAHHFAQWGRGQMMQEAVEGWVAVDSDTDGKRRVTFFPKKPVRDVLTEYKYWAATRPRYESIELDSNAFPELKWEDEPKKVRIIIVKEGEK